MGYGWRMCFITTCMDDEGQKVMRGDYGANVHGQQPVATHVGSHAATELLDLIVLEHLYLPTGFLMSVRL